MNVFFKREMGLHARIDVAPAGLDLRLVVMPGRFLVQTVDVLDQRLVLVVQSIYPYQEGVIPRRVGAGRAVPGPAAGRMILARHGPGCRPGVDIPGRHGHACLAGAEGLQVILTSILSYPAGPLGVRLHPRRVQSVLSGL